MKHPNPLRQLRQNAGMSLKSLSLSTGLPIEELSGIERGRITPAGEVRQALSALWPDAFSTDEQDQPALTIPPNLEKLTLDPKHAHQCTPHILRTLCRLEIRRGNALSVDDWALLLKHFHAMHLNHHITTVPDPPAGRLKP